MLGNRKLVTTPIVRYSVLIGHTFATSQLHSGSFRVSVLPNMHTAVVYCGESMEILQ